MQSIYRKHNPKGRVAYSSKLSCSTSQPFPSPPCPCFCLPLFLSLYKTEFIMACIFPPPQLSLNEDECLGTLRYGALPFLHLDVALLQGL